MREISATPVLQIAGAYTANDVVGALLTFTFSSAAERNVEVNRLILIDHDKENAEFWLWLFDASPTAPARTDAAAFEPVAADLLKVVGKIHIETTDYTDSASDSVAIKELDFPAQSAAGLAVYGVLVCVGTPTYTAADDLVLSIFVE
jgi:hypothetical protein